MPEKTIAIITARGGSKRLPRKNIKPFFGKPIIAYSIDVALRSEIFDEVMVSTDSTEVADVARKYGAKVPFMRSPKTSDDFSDTLDVLKEVIEEYRNLGVIFDVLCCIYPCAPLLRVSTLKDAYTKLENHAGVCAVCQFPSPIECALKMENCYLEYENPPSTHPRRSQDALLRYFDCGTFYFCRVDQMYQSDSVIPEKTFGYIMSDQETQDIDTQDNWDLAEVKYEFLRRRGIV